MRGAVKGTSRLQGTGLREDRGCGRRPRSGRGARSATLPGPTARSGARCRSLPRSRTRRRGRPRWSRSLRPGPRSRPLRRRVARPSCPEVAKAERDRVEGADAHRLVVLRARDEHPLPFPELECFQRPVRRLDEPQVTDTLARVDSGACPGGRPFASSAARAGASFLRARSSARTASTSGVMSGAPAATARRQQHHPMTPGYPRERLGAGVGAWCAGRGGRAGPSVGTRSGNMRMVRRTWTTASRAARHVRPGLVDGAA